MPQGHDAVVHIHDPPDKPLFINHVLIGIDLFAQDLTHQQTMGQMMQGIGAHLLGFHLGDLIPEGTGHFEVAPGQLLDVRYQLIVVVILRLDATGPRLEAHVDVLGHQNKTSLRLTGLHGHHIVDDAVIVQVIRQWRPVVVRLGHQHRQRALGDRLRPPGDGDTRFHLCRGGTAQHPVDLANGRTAVCRRMGFAALQLVQLLQHRHGNHHPVFLKIE